MKSCIFPIAILLGLVYTAPAPQLLGTSATSPTTQNTYTSSGGSPSQDQPVQEAASGFKTCAPPADANEWIQIPPNTTPNNNDRFRYFATHIDDELLRRQIPASINAVNEGIYPASHGRLTDPIPNNYWEFPTFANFTIEGFEGQPSLIWTNAQSAVGAMKEFVRRYSYVKGGIEVAININWCPIGVAKLKYRTPPVPPVEGMDVSEAVETLGGGVASA